MYGRLYRKNMDGGNSFFMPIEKGLELVSNSDSVAMFYDNPIYSYKEQHCKVRSIKWISITLSIFNSYFDKVLFLGWNISYLSIGELYEIFPQGVSKLPQIDQKMSKEVHYIE